MVKDSTRALANTIKRKIESEGINAKDLTDLLDICIHVLANEDDLEWSLKVSNYIKASCSIGIRASIQIYELDSVYWNTLRFEAPFLFDSYLLFLERKRDASEKFYAPKRRHLNKHGLIQAMQDLEDDKLDTLSISMPPGTQKCQPLYSKVLTEDGFIEMRDVVVGTRVITPKGKISTVLSTSVVQKRPIYELTFDDGSKARCSDNHLWKVQSRDDRNKARFGENGRYRILELSQILKNYKVENGKRLNYSIDYVENIDFEKKESLEIDPYLLGVLIGDGSITDGNMSFTTIDTEIVERVKMNMPPEFELIKRGKCGYYIKTNTYYLRGKSSLRKSLEKYNLKGLGSKDKHIPEEYLYARKTDRIWLLRGLMDTDGYASKKSTNCSYTTISEKLANNVKELVNSLGGYASISKLKAGYKKNGNYIQCNDCYTVTIGFDSSKENPFYLKRKSERYNPKRNVIKRFIKNIEYVGVEECKCIYIDDDEHMYVTDNYIATHNTTLEKFFASWIIGKHPDDFSLFYSHSGDITRMFYDGVLDITTNKEEYCWNEIFPKVKLKSTDAKREQINFNKYKPFANLQCTSVGSKNAGKVRCNRYLYCDDLIGGIEEALNKNMLDKLWRIYSIDARQRKLNQQVKEIHIATRWSVHDVIGRLKALYSDSDRARFIEIPDIDPITGESNFDYDFNGMTVEFFNDQALLMDEISYKCLYKNQPIEREGLLYHNEELRRYLELPNREPDAIMGIVDTKDKGTDFFFHPCMYVYGNDHYLVECICDDNSDYGKQYENSANLIVNRNMQQCQFETNNGGGRVAYEVSTRVKSKGGRCNITEKFSTSNKETKIIVNSDWVKKNIVFQDKSMYSAKSDYGKMMSFLLTYTVSGKNPHDDVPDGLSSYALFITNGLPVKIEAGKNPFYN